MTERSDARPKVVRPRDAASLILLRGRGREVEVLAGRRPLHLRFMPGAYVFPGGAIDPPDYAPWAVETGTERLSPRLTHCARAALRETWEETGVLIGRPSEEPLQAPAQLPIEAAYRERGLAAAFDALTYVGRAITPAHSPRRFNTRFFLGEGDIVCGEPTASEELEDVRWHPVGRELLQGFRDVTRFMLERAMALREGTADGAPPLFYTVKSTRRIGICREAARGG
jgi:8-oxo-dGTP pyrophosphatase MutT (NUDIX family)